MALIRNATTFLEERYDTIANLNVALLKLEPCLLSEYLIGNAIAYYPMVSGSNPPSAQLSLRLKRVASSL